MRFLGGDPFIMENQLIPFGKYKGQPSWIKILLINEYNGVGISEENFIKLFKTQGITVLFIKDIL